MFNISHFIIDFKENFERHWVPYVKNITSSLNTDTSILNSGDRLRPLLVCWGYLLGCSIGNLTPSLDYIVKVATPFELVHKASIILDDLLDGDTKRKGIATFHTQFGTDNAIIYAILLLNVAVTEAANYKNIVPNYPEELSKLINTMGQGALLEINTDGSNRNLKRSLTMLQEQTNCLISNSLGTGFLSIHKVKDNKYQRVLEIGEALGYIFQILNDAEPFFNSDYVVQHKGNLNYDKICNCKNSVLALLNYRITKDGKKLSDNCSYLDILLLIKEYNIKEEIYNQVTNRNRFITNSIKKLDTPVASELLNFYEKVYKLALIRAFG